MKQGCNISLPLILSLLFALSSCSGGRIEKTSGQIIDNAQGAVRSTSETIDKKVWVPADEAPSRSDDTEDEEQDLAEHQAPITPVN